MLEMMTGSELVTEWDINVSNPAAEFLPLWMELSKSTENYDWNADARGVQQHNTCSAIMGMALHIMLACVLVTASSIKLSG